MNMAFNSLQDRNNVLKSRLLHERLNCGCYPFYSFKREMSQILNEYLHHKSLFKAASVVGINPKTAFGWYVQGQKGNPQFKVFYLRINHINNRQSPDGATPQNEEVAGYGNGEYEISNYGDGWSYTTYVDGERIFVISKDLDSLKNKVKSKGLPFS